MSSEILTQGGNCYNERVNDVIWEGGRYRYSEKGGKDGREDSICELWSDLDLKGTGEFCIQKGKKGIPGRWNSLCKGKEYRKS